jgi:hypothetical protein
MLAGVPLQKAGHTWDYGGLDEAWRRFARPQPTWVVVVRLTATTDEWSR